MINVSSSARPEQEIWCQDKSSAEMQFWLRDEQVKPQQRRDRSGPRARKASDVRETNALADGDTDRVRLRVFSCKA